MSRWMSNRMRMSARAEDGAISVTALFVVAAIAVVVYALLGAATGDPDKYGRVIVPSTSLVTLPASEVDISYQEATASESVPLEVPSDLRVVMVDGTGVALETNARGGSRTWEGGIASKPILAFTPPYEGTFEVRVESDAAKARPNPALGFGESPVSAVGDRLSRVGELLLSPYGAVAGALLVLAFFWPNIQRAWMRRDR